MKVASPKLCGECTSRSQMWITQQARYLPPRLQKHLPSFLLPSECYSFPATPKWEDIKELNLQFVSTLHSLSFFFFPETQQAHACEVSERSLSRVWLFVTPWTIESMEFSRPEYWSGSPFPSPEDLPNPGIEPRSLTLKADSLTSWTTREAQICSISSRYSVLCHILFLQYLVLVFPAGRNRNVVLESYLIMFIAGHYGKGAACQLYPFWVCA